MWPRTWHFGHKENKDKLIGTFSSGQDQSPTSRSTTLKAAHIHGHGKEDHTDVCIVTGRFTPCPSETSRTRFHVEGLTPTGESSMRRPWTSTTTSSSSHNANGSSLDVQSAVALRSTRHTTWRRDAQDISQANPRKSSGQSSPPQVAIP